MNALDVFSYGAQQVRTVLVDGEPWFVAADVARILDIGNPRPSLALLDDDEKGVSTIDTPGGRQSVTTVNEPGLYSLILRSRKAEARDFKRWVTHSVLPAIRKTGQYFAPQPEDDALLVARALVAAQGMLAAKDERIAELTPSAEAWVSLASAEGDFEIADAAKMLSRAGVMTGQTRLFSSLAELGWIFRGGDRKWRCYQTVIEQGLMAEKPGKGYYHPTTGEWTLGAPQPRLTMKGIDKLRIRLGSLLTAVV